MEQKVVYDVHVDAWIANISDGEFEINVTISDGILCTLNFREDGSFFFTPISEINRSIESARTELESLHSQESS